MTKPNSTEIIVVLDRSGSMQSIAHDMQGGFNTFIEEQKTLPGDCKVSLMQFDSTYEVVYVAKDVHEVPPLVIEPRGMTALLDAVGKAMTQTGERFAAMREEERPEKVLFVIITDGEENASMDFNRGKIFDMISHQRGVYNWEFMFLGANQDSIAVASSIGISTTNTVTFDANAIGTRAIYNGISEGVKRYRSSNSSRMDDIFNQDRYISIVDAIKTGG